MKDIKGRNKLIIVDLDGTLVDTKDVNYNAYKEAVGVYGYSIDYQYYCDFCNGRHYMEFLPQITTTDDSILKEMHKIKKKAYSKYLDRAVLNHGLIDIISALKEKGYKTALVTTASKKNCEELLQYFKIKPLFELILTHDDIKNAKPNPDGFNRAMAYFDVDPYDTMIFEDSDIGLKAAERSKAFYFKTFKFC